MRINKVLITAYLSLIMLLSNQVVATETNSDNFKSRLAEIIQIVVPANGYINKGIHDSLWNTLPAHMLLNFEDPEVARTFKKQLDKLFVQAMLFQYATWDSAGRTLESGKLTYHPDYKKHQKSILNQGYITAAKNGDRVIQSALNRTPIENSQGMFYITTETVNTVLNNLDGSLERASLLFNQKWNPKVKERFLKRAHVKTISAFPYTFEEAKFNDVAVYSYTSRLSEISEKSMSWLPIENDIAPSDAILETMTNEILKYYGVGSSEIFTYSSKWRGLLAHKGSGVGYASDRKVNFSVATVIRTDLGGFLMFIGASGDSQVEADRFLEELLEQTQLAN